MQPPSSVSPAFPWYPLLPEQEAAVSAGLRNDVPLLLGIVIFSAIFVYCGNLIADIIYNFVDPRIKESEEDG